MTFLVNKGLKNFIKHETFSVLRSIF